MRARSALFTVLGDLVHPVGEEVWLQGLTTAMGALGITPEATRTALHRMTREGWVEPRRVGRFAAYRLTGRGKDRLAEAAVRIYRLRAVEWDGCWHWLRLEHTPEPLGRALSWMGFGFTPGQTWVSPFDHGPRLAAVLAEHEARPRYLLRGEADPGVLAVEATNANLVRQAWDLTAIREAHARFLRDWSDPDGLPTRGAKAFAERVRLVHQWRSFLFLDPGLPAQLLPEDWLGYEAADCFRRSYERLAGPSWTWWTEATEGPPVLDANGDRPIRSPFDVEAHALRG